MRLHDAMVVKQVFSFNGKDGARKGKDEGGGEHTELSFWQCDPAHQLDRKRTAIATTTITRAQLKKKHGIGGSSCKQECIKGTWKETSHGDIHAPSLLEMGVVGVVVVMVLVLAWSATTMRSSLGNSTCLTWAIHCQRSRVHA